MNHFRGVLSFGTAAVLAAFAFLPIDSLAQDTSSGPGRKSDQWIHVRVESKEDRGETVRVNVPVEMAAKVLPAIHDKQFHDGKVHFDADETKDVDLRAILDAVRSAQDGEYVTVQSNENNVRVSKSGGYLYVHVTERCEGKHGTGKDAQPGEKAGVAQESKVEIKVPMKVVDALLSAGKDELDIVAALNALAAHGDTELVTVKDNQNTVRVWVDSKNISE